MGYFGITLGDPCGIGPEITLKALMSASDEQDKVILFGSVQVLEYYNQLLEYAFEFHEIKELKDFKLGKINVYDAHPITMDEIKIGQLSSIGGACAFDSVVAAIQFALRKDIDSVVTAPLNKEALHMAGHMYAGHTEIFGEFTKGDSFAMLLWSDALKCIHATTHVSLKDACDLCQKERIVDVVRLADATLKKIGYSEPRIAVSGLNPHSGEGGLFGQEEIEEIIPAVNKAKAEGMCVTGPVPPDTVFYRTLKGEFDIVVAMYHDQGHIPLKLLAFDTGVNITVGLDVVRTSVDHGTAFDIAGKGIADEKSLLKAIEIGKKL